MIKINLLPAEKAKKVRKDIERKSQIFIATAIVLTTFIIIGYIWYLLDGKLNNIEAQRISLDNELSSLKIKIKEVENFEIDKKNYEDKIDVIKRLKANQSGPVHMLDEISKSTTPKIWLTLLSEQDGRIDIEGRGLLISEIVDFINNLKKTGIFSNIQLIESKQTVEEDMPVYFFKIKCNLSIS